VPDEIEKFDPESLQRSVWHMRKMGMSWDAIATQINETYESELNAVQIATVYRTYMSSMVQVYGPEDRAHALALELERLNDLQESVWPIAMRGDKDGVKSALDIMKQRHKLLGLDMVDGSDKQAVANILIVGEDKVQWMEALDHGRASGTIMPGAVEDDEEDTEEG